MDFYVSPLDNFATGATSWLVTRRDGAPENGVAICASRADAVERATLMARYQRASGQDSRVLLRVDASRAWDVVWSGD